MCFEFDSVPPVPVAAGAAVDHRDLELESADGTRFAAFAALPEERGAAGVVILPDVRGLYRFYESWPSASPSVASPPSRSTTSAGLPASRSAATTFRT
jgi:hypothetical protein